MTNKVGRNCPEVSRMGRQATHECTWVTRHHDNRPVINKRVVQRLVLAHLAMLGLILLMLSIC